MGGEFLTTAQEKDKEVCTVADDLLKPQQSIWNQAGNQATQRLFSPAPLMSVAPAPTSLPPSPPPIVIHWDEYTPWVFTVEGSPSPSALSMELYGFDITTRSPLALKPMSVQGSLLYISEPELLLPAYNERFHDAMRKAFAEDVQKLEGFIFDDSNTDEGMDILSKWARRGSMRTPGGRTYFDMFLGHLRSNYWYRDYLVTTGKKHTYFDSLFDWAGGRAGQVSTLIAENSLEFGAFRPTWVVAEAALQPRTAGARDSVTPVVNKELVERSADLILEKLKWRTNAKDSHVIADTLIGMPGPEQSHVLKDMMSRYDERTWIGLGRYGEASEGGMLYWLFEDLTGDDRDRLSKSLVENGVFTEAQAATLVEGRGIISRNLPWTTGKIGQMAESRVKYWADKAVHEDSKMAYFWGTVDSLFLPENIDTTVMVIAGAKIPGAVAGVSKLAASALTVLGVGYMSYESTLAIAKLATGKDEKGNSLDAGQKLSAALTLGSNILFAAAGLMELRRGPGGTDLAPRSLMETEPAMPKALGPATEGIALPAARPGELLTSPQAATPVEWRVMDFDSNTGDLTAIGRRGDDYIVVRINSQTLNGEAIHPRTGRVLRVQGGIPVESDLAALPGTKAPAEVSPEGAPTTPSLETTTQKSLPSGPVSVAEQTTRIQDLLARQKQVEKDLVQQKSNYGTAARQIDVLERIKASGKASQAQEDLLEKTNDAYGRARKSEDALQKEQQRIKRELADIRKHAVRAQSDTEHELSVYERQVADNPGAKVGKQITLDVKDVATGVTEELRVDVGVFEKGELKIVEAKFSANDDLTAGKLSSGVYTESQNIAYRWIANGNKVEVIPRGANAKNMGLPVGEPIKVTPKVEVHVNSPEGIQVRDFKDTI